MKKVLIMILCVILLTNITAVAEIAIQTFYDVPVDFSKLVDPKDPNKTIFSGAYRIPFIVEEEERSVVV